MTQNICTRRSLWIFFWDVFQVYVGAVLGETEILTIFDLILESFWVYIDPEGFRLEVKWCQNIRFTENKPYVHLKKVVQIFWVITDDSSGQMGSKNQFDLDWPQPNLTIFLDKRPIVNPNDGFLSQLITYEGILNAIKNRYSFGRDHFDDGAGEQFDSDIDLHNEIRVKKLVQFIQEREKAEIRRSKSNSRSSKR